MTQEVVTGTIGVVVLNWFTEEETIACVRSVLSSGDTDVAVYVVDNGSTPAGRRYLETELPGAVLLGDGVNRGFAAGANAGMRRALEEGCAAVFLVNNDAILSAGCLAALRAAEGAVVNPLIVRHDRPEIVWFAGGRVAFHGRGLHRGFGRSAAAPASTRPSSFATGCAMFLPAATIRRIGFFDESLFAYGEDLDYSLRAAEARLPIVLAGSARVLHKESVSVKRNVGKEFRDYYVVRNMVLLLRKHCGAGGLLLRLPLLAALEVLFPAAVFLVRGETRRVRALAQGLADGLAGRAGARWPGKGG